MCSCLVSFFEKRWAGNTLKLQQRLGFELDMQESGVTAASDREGECPWFLGFFHRWERVCFSLPRRIEEWVPLLVRARSKLLDRL